MKKKVKLLILVLSHDEEPYVSLTNCIRDTWGDNDRDDVDIFYYYGGADEFNVVDDCIYSNGEEGLKNIGYKTLKSFEYLYNEYEFDYLLRTNSSSYIDVDSVMEYLEDKDDTLFYHGILGKNNGKFFGSGSGYFLSNDVVKIILDNRDMWNHSIIDDVALSKMLFDLNIIPTCGRRADVESITTDRMIFRSNSNGVLNYNINITNSDELKALNIYHYRCKNHNDRNIDIKVMKRLHSLYNK